MSLSDAGCPLPAQQSCRSSAPFSPQATSPFNHFVASEPPDHSRERGDLSSHQLASTPDAVGPFITELRVSADRAARPTPMTSLNGSRILEAENGLVTQCHSSSQSVVASEHRSRIASPRRMHAIAVDKRHDDGDDKSSEASSVNSDTSEGSKGASVDLLLRRSDGAVDVRKHQPPTTGLPVRMHEGTTTAAREEASANQAKTTCAPEVAAFTAAAQAALRAMDDTATQAQLAYLKTIDPRGRSGDVNVCKDTLVSKRRVNAASGRRWS